VLVFKLKGNFVKFLKLLVTQNQ